MKNTGRRNILDVVLDEYVVWGGPVVTRREALADCRANGFDAKAIDTLVFGRNAVPAPSDPAAHLAFLRQIQEAICPKCGDADLAYRIAEGRHQCADDVKVDANMMWG